MTDIILTNEQQELYDSWTKMQIYKAYILEAKKAKELNKEVNRLGRKLAEIKFMAGGK